MINSISHTNGVVRHAYIVRVTRYVLLYSLLVLTVFPAFAVGEAGQDLPVLEIGVGARPLGMGGAFSSIAGDISSSFYNPAGLSYLKKKELVTMQGDLFLGTKYYSLTYGQPVTAKDGFAVSWMRLSTAAQDLTNSSGTIEGSFSSQDEALTLSYGRTFSPLSIGASVKFISRTLQNATGSGLGFDLGGYYRFSQILACSLVAKDINESQVHWTTGKTDSILPSLRAGFSFQPFTSLSLAAEAGKKLKGDHSILIYSGLEWWPMEMFALRCGSDENRLSGGISLKTSVFQIDYAYLNHEDLGGTSKLSISIIL